MAFAPCQGLGMSQEEAGTESFACGILPPKYATQLPFGPFLKALRDYLHICKRPGREVRLRVHLELKEPGRKTEGCSLLPLLDCRGQEIKSLTPGEPNTA